MPQFYALVISLGGLALIFEFQKIRLDSLEKLKERVAEKIKLQKRRERITESKSRVAEKRISRTPKAHSKSAHLPEIKALYRRAEIDFSRGDIEHAEQLLVQLLALQPNHPDANEKLALIYLKTDRSRKAELIYQDLVKQDPRNAVYISNLGLAHYKQNRYREAISAYESAIEIDSKKPGRYAALGQIYLLTRQPKKALENFECAYRRARRNVEYLFLINEAYKQLGDWQSSRQTLEKILQIQPYNQTAKDELRKLSEQHVLHEPEEN